MLKNRKFIMNLFIVIGVIFTLFLSGCTNKESEESSNPGPETSSQNSGDAKEGGTLKVGLMADTMNLGYPAEQPAIGQLLHGRAALETLGRYNEEGEITPWLADSWETDPEEETITIKLKKGITFHDGTDFNAEAVKWNIEQYIEAKRAEMAGIQSVEVVDESTVKVNLDGWNSSALEGVVYIVFMVSPTSYEENGKDWAMKNPIGTGPFKLESWEAEVAIKFIKNDAYWQEGKPYLDSIEYHIIKDPMTAEAAFRTKEVDLAINIAGTTLSEMAEEGFVVSTSTLGGSQGVGIIPDSANPNSPFSDVRVRQAVAYAIDKEMINDTILHGLGVVTNQWGPPNAWSYNPDMEGFPYNPEKAKELLAEAGYPNGFKTKFTTLNVAVPSMDVAIQNYLSQVGIEVEIVTVDHAKYNEIAYGEWDGLLDWYYTSGADLALYMNRHFGVNGSVYFQHIDHPDKVDELLLEARLASDMERKKEISFELQKAVFEEYTLAIPSYIGVGSSVKHSYVHDDGFTTLDPYSFTPEEAWIDK